jgi:type IV secretory pathway VirB2 component (pilin)
VVAEIDGVVKLVPVPKLAPPVAAAYQLMVPPLDAALKVTMPVPHLLPGVVPVIVGADAFTVAITAVLDAVVHVPLVAST